MSKLIHKPMLASPIRDLKLLRYPLLGSPKLDGIRALTLGGLVSRNLKPIPNDYIRSLAKGLPDNLDGELLLTNVDANKQMSMANFNETSGSIMRQSGTPNVHYYVFDYVKTSLLTIASQRLVDLAQVIEQQEALEAKIKRGDWPDYSTFIQMVAQKEITSEKELLEYEEICLSMGYEGVMVRDPNSPYKEGRSTEAEGYLLKLKRFADGEAKIVNFEEKMHNANEAEEDLLGRTKRSQAKAGLVPTGTLGKIYVVDIKSKIEFEIGTGFNDALRAKIWRSRKSYLGKIVKYKYQSKGMKDKPRFPVFLGFRDPNDMGE